MSKLKKIWNNFWFVSARSVNIGCFRFFFFAHIFIGFYSWENTRASLPEVLWHPVWVYSLFGSPPVGGEVAQILLMVYKSFILMSSLGLFTRFSTASCAFLSFFLFAIEQSYGFLLGFWTFIFIPQLILAFSPCGDYFSLDNLLFKKDSSQKSVHYYWPLRLIQVTFLLSFFFAGWTKLVQSGFEWVASENLRNWILLGHYLPQISEFARDLNIGPRLAEFPLLCSFMAGCALLVELSAPLYFVLRSWTRYIPIFALIALQVGIELLVTGGYFAACAAYFSFVPYLALKDHLENLTR